ncbi:MAG: hypothetical protein RLZZ157_1402 [Pseudomonadota bacterium]
MTQDSYVFCGIGGSGMLPLAMLVHHKGAQVIGTDRAFDQGRAPDKQAYLTRHGIAICPQDGSALSDKSQILVTSTAVEAQVPDVARARALGARHITRAQLLSDLFNRAQSPVAIAGTSGKSTITAMLGWILYAHGRAPTIVNGAIMANFRGPDSQFASFVAGDGPDFIAEVDESDGSIAHYNPQVALLSNITLDHKPIDELKALFGDYLARAKSVVANLDNPDVAALVAQVTDTPCVTYSLVDRGADVFGVRGDDGTWQVSGSDGASSPLNLQVFGDYNISNALGAIAAAHALGIGRAAATSYLAGFKGVARRMEVVGQVRGVTIYDDFGHNPDKIAASLAALASRHARILCLFQPHGYRPLELLGTQLVETFASGLRAGDHVWLTEPVYFGGTVERKPIVAGLVDELGADRATYLPQRDDFPSRIARLAQSGDAVVVMGARDDSLTELAQAVALALATVPEHSLV